MPLSIPRIARSTRDALIAMAERGLSRPAKASKPTIDRNASSCLPVWYRADDYRRQHGEQVLSLPGNLLHYCRNRCCSGSAPRFAVSPKGNRCSNSCSAVFLKTLRWSNILMSGSFMSKRITAGRCVRAASMPRRPMPASRTFPNPVGQKDKVGHCANIAIVGETVLQLLRADPWTRDVSIILFTAFAGDRDRLRALRLRRHRAEALPGAEAMRRGAPGPLLAHWRGQHHNSPECGPEKGGLCPYNRNCLAGRIWQASSANGKPLAPTRLC
jgi:CheY-like chemotaxis protein